MKYRKPLIWVILEFIDDDRLKLWWAGIEVKLNSFLLRVLLHWAAVVAQSSWDPGDSLEW